MTMLPAQFGAAAAEAGSLTPSLLAMSGGGVRIDFDRTFLVQMIIFAALIFVLEPLLFNPVLRVFQERERRTEGAREDARVMQEEAGELLQQYERALARVRQVASEERERVRAETRKLEAQIMEEATRTASAVVQEGRSKIAGEVAGMRTELDAQATSIAQEMAARVLGRSLR
jgi:F-type H+-transporting ATPase subunit b